MTFEHRHPARAASDRGGEVRDLDAAPSLPRSAPGDATGAVVTLFRLMEAHACRCPHCLAAGRRFPHDPPQLLLPLGWPDVVVAIDRQRRAI